MDDVIVPELQNTVIPKPLEVQEIEGEQIKEEKDLASVAEHPGWNILLDEIEDSIKSYSDLSRFVNFTGGVNELASDVRASAVIVEFLTNFKGKVEDAVESTRR